jgi:hypothetical protein
MQDELQQRVAKEQGWARALLAHQPRGGCTLERRMHLRSGHCQLCSQVRVAGHLAVRERQPKQDDQVLRLEGDLPIRTGPVQCHSLFANSEYYSY